MVISCKHIETLARHLHVSESRERVTAMLKSSDPFRQMGMYMCHSYMESLPTLKILLNIFHATGILMTVIGLLSTVVVLCFVLVGVLIAVIVAQTKHLSGKNAYFTRVKTYCRIACRIPSRGERA